MKKALVLGLLVLSLGVAASAQTWVGSWDFDISFLIVDPVIVIDDLTSVLSVDYTIGGITFGTDMWVSEAELDGLQFGAAGQFGAFSFWSLVVFDPMLVAWVDWENLVSVSIAGVDIYGAFVLHDVELSEQTPSSVGTGWAIGAHAVAGAVEIWAEADFNLAGNAVNYYDYGFDSLYAWDISANCAGELGYGMWAILDDTCAPGFSAFDLLVEAPLGCLDLLVGLHFTCEGFDNISFQLNDVNLGAGWFQLDDLNVTFTADTKTVWTDFTLTFGSAVCVTPYFDLVQVGINEIDGIKLNALLLSYTFDGVTIKAGENFSYYAGFTTSGTLTTTASCAVSGANEFVGLWYDGDSCCEGLIAASFVIYFDGLNGNVVDGDGVVIDVSTSHGLFDFVWFMADVEVGISKNFSLRAGMDVSDLGLYNISTGFSFSW